MLRKLRKVEQEGGRLLGVDLALVHDSAGFYRAICLRFEAMPLVFRIGAGKRSFFGAALTTLRCRKEEVLRPVDQQSVWKDCIGRHLRYAELLVGLSQESLTHNGVQLDFRDEVTLEGPVLQLTVFAARWVTSVVGPGRYV